MSETIETIETKAWGNTKPKPERDIQGRRWCLTLNNYTDEEYETLRQEFSKFPYVIGKEVGECGVPHLQCYVEWKTRFSTLKKINNRLHIERAKGSKDDNVKYCSKDSDYITNIIFKEVIPEPIEPPLELSKWMEKVIEIIRTPCDERTINWIIDGKGGSGKTKFCKYIIERFEDVFYFTGGKATDITSQLLLVDNDPRLCLFDLPRTSEGYVSYNALEQVKNGLINSPKYKGGMKCFKTPTVIVFANWEPEFEKLSRDRWNIIKLE